MVKAERVGHDSREKVAAALLADDFDQPGSEIMQLPPVRAINSLFSLLYHGDTTIKSRAVRLLGMNVARLAETDMEGARNVVRRLMWNLNDESGGIGWGSPEALGEILARHEGLAREYAHILLSYARRDGNYIENEVLQRGLIWAVSRLWGSRPEVLGDLKQHLRLYLESGDAAVRGLAAELAGRLGDKDACDRLILLLGDDSLYDSPMEEERGLKRRVNDSARAALARLGC